MVAKREYTNTGCGKRIFRQYKLWHNTSGTVMYVLEKLVGLMVMVTVYGGENVELGIRVNSQNC